jgi:hypothetical protein
MSFLINPYSFSKPLSFTYRAQANSAASTVVIPSGTVIGDIIILFDKAINSTGEPTTVVPTDFTQIDLGFNGVRKHIVSYKVAVSGDPGATITGMNGTSANRKMIVVIQPSATIKDLAINDKASEQTDGTPTNQVANASAEVNPTLVLGFYGQQAATSQSMSPSADGTVSNDTVNYIRYKIYNSSPQDVTVSEGDGGLSNYLCSFYITANG